MFDYLFSSRIPCSGEAQFPGVNNGVGLKNSVLQDPFVLSDIMYRVMISGERLDRERISERHVLN